MSKDHLSFWDRLRARWQKLPDETSMDSQSVMGGETEASLPLDSRKGNEPGRVDGDGEEELPLLPMSKGSSSFRVGDIGMTIIVSLASAFAVVVTLSFIGGAGFVTKQDFAVNMLAVSTAVEQVKGELAKGQSDITSQVNTSVKQSVSLWDSKLSSLDNKVAGLTTKVNGYEATLGSLNDRIAGYDDDIHSLRQDIVSLQNQSGGDKVSVDGTASLKIIINGVAVPIPLVVTNDSDTSVTVPVKLVLASATTGIMVNKASMSGTYSVSISGSTVTLFTTAEVGAGSSVTFNMWVALDYTGTSPNIWSAVWSKQ